MKIAISGSTGLIGKALSTYLRQTGHQVIALVREERQATDATHCWWQPERGIRQPEKLAAIDAVVHLAGRGIADHRWTPREKLLLRESRVDTTRRLCDDLNQLPEPPTTFLSASAVGIYGDCGEEVVTEKHIAGSGFLAQLAVDWEAASAPLALLGMRVVHARFGIAIAAEGGALAKMLPLFRLGLGGRLGSGRQYWSWISLNDTLRALEFLLTDENCQGAFNVVAPNPVTNSQFTRDLARAVQRTRFFPVPAMALRWILGEMADATLLASCRAHPERLTSVGFHFNEPTLPEALARL